MSTFVPIFCLAQQLVPPKAEPPTIFPRTKDTVSRTVSIPENKRPNLPDTEPVPPEPKKRTNRKASITNSEKEEPLFDLKQSMPIENNKDQKDIQPVKTDEKDSDVAQNVIQLERHKENNNKACKKTDKPVILIKEDGRIDWTLAPDRPLEAESKVLMETRESGGHLEELDKANLKVSQSERIIDSVVEEKKQLSIICVEKEPEVEPSSQECKRSSEKTSEVEKKVKPPAAVFWKNSTDEQQPVKPLERFIGKETVNEEDVKPVEKEDPVDKAEKDSLKPSVRSKGRSAGEKVPLKHVSKETEETFPQLKASGNNSEEDRQKDHVKQQVSREAEREKMQLQERVPSITDLDKQSVLQSEKPLEKEVGFVPLKPPVRTKSKPKGGLENQLSKEAETGQDEQRLTTVTVKTVTDLPQKLPLMPVEKEANEKLVFEKTVSVTPDAEISERVKQSGKTTEKDAQQLIKQPVKPSREEPEGAKKQAVEVVKREEKQQAVKMTEDVPLLYISEDETFSEALTEIPVNHSHRNIQPVDCFAQGSTQPSTLPLQKIQPSEDAPPDIEISTEDEAHMQEAAVKTQAAIKGYKEMRPVFKEVFKNQNADLHGTVTLVCVVEGKPSTVRWLKNGQLVANDKRCRTETTEDGVCTLVIKNLTTSDSGIYTCEVVNMFGVTSYNGNITVVKPQQPAPINQRPVHPPLAAITPLQLAKPNLESQADSQAQNLPQTQTQVPSLGTNGANYVESVSISLWEAYNLTEQDTSVNLQERRGSSLIAASSSELCIYIPCVMTISMDFLHYIAHGVLLSTVSSPSDYETAPDVMEHMETSPAVSRLE